MHNPLAERGGPYVLNASRSSGVAEAGWRGRGFCTDQPIAFRASQPRCGKTSASPSSPAIQAATFGLVHNPPSGGGFKQTSLELLQQAGREITRIAVAFEAGRDGFWLARWLRAHGIEAHVIHPTSIAVSREHRRAKTDRLDTALLKRVFLGWLRGEPEHCHMAAIPTLEEEDARRPTRERESLVGERTRIVNRIKAALARLGVRGFKPTLRKALERLDALRTPEGTALPPNTRAELHRDMARLRFVTEQIQQIEAARSQRLEQAGAEGPNAMVRLLAQVVGHGRPEAFFNTDQGSQFTSHDFTDVLLKAGIAISMDGKGSGGTTSSSSGSGYPSSTKRCISGPTTRSARPAPRSAGIKPSTIAHQNAHLAMFLRRIGFAVQGPVPRGVLDGALPLGRARGQQNCQGWRG